MRFLLTGASGFLGRHIARRLIDRGDEPLLLARATSQMPADIAPAQVARYSDADGIRKAIHAWKPDCVIHTACSYGRRHERLAELVSTNVTFGLDVMEALADGHASGPKLFINAGTSLQRNLNAYALTKAQFVECAQTLARTRTDLQFVNLRLEHMYGPHDDTSKFIGHVLRACRQSNAPLKLTSGLQRRDFIHVSDVVSAFLAVAERQELLDTPVSEMDVGTGEAPTVREVVEKIHRLTNSRTELQFGALPLRDSEQMLSCADTARLRGLGWTPLHNLDSGLQDLIDSDSSQ